MRVILSLTHTHIIFHMVKAQNKKDYCRINLHGLQDLRPAVLSRCLVIYDQRSSVCSLSSRSVVCSLRSAVCSLQMSDTGKLLSCRQLIIWSLVVDNLRHRLRFSVVDNFKLSITNSRRQLNPGLWRDTVIEGIQQDGFLIELRSFFGSVKIEININK